MIRIVLFNSVYKWGESRTFFSTIFGKETNGFGLLLDDVFVGLQNIFFFIDKIFEL